MIELLGYVFLALVVVVVGLILSVMAIPIRIFGGYHLYFRRKENDELPTPSRYLKFTVIFEMN